MSIKKRAGAVKQLSLPRNCNSRRVIQKQTSLDLSSRKKNENEKEKEKENDCDASSISWSGRKEPDVNLHVCASAISNRNGEHTTIVGRQSLSKAASVVKPRSVKLAWGDHRPTESNPMVEIVAQKCRGQIRPQTAKPAKREYSTNTILYSRQQFAERLRQACRERELSKPNLDIFLGNSAETRDPPSGFNVETLNYKSDFRNRATESFTNFVLLDQTVLKPSNTPPSATDCGPYSVFSTKPKPEPEEVAHRVSDISVIKDVAQMSETAFSEVQVYPSERFKSDRQDLSSSFGSLVNNGESDGSTSDEEPTESRTNLEYSSATSETAPPLRFPPNNESGSKELSSESSFESVDESQEWGRQAITSQPLHTPLSASSRRQQFRNNPQKAIDKSVSAPTTPQPQTCKTVKKIGQSPLPRVSTSTASGQTTPKSVSAHKPESVKRLSSVRSQSFEQPSEGAGYRSYERNIKSAPPKRKLKAVRRKLHKPFYGGSSASDDDGSSRIGRRRMTIFNGPKDVETMVSLLSPTESETEPDGPDSTVLLTNDPTPLPHENSSSMEPKIGREEPREIKPPPMLFLRKSPKPVTFKLLGSTGRSYSTLYPCRRGMAAFGGFGALNDEHVESTARSRTRTQIDEILDQKSSTSSSISEPRLPMKKCVRLRLTENLGEMSTEDERQQDKENASDSGKPLRRQESEMVLHPILVQTNLTCNIKVTPKFPLAKTYEAPSEPTYKNESEEGLASKEPQFQTSKERECWDLFQKMLDKGVPVSFDTVLRGMLTPTEYRLRKNALIS